MDRGFTKGRLMAILLCIVLIATMLPVAASAATLSAPKMKKAVLTDNGIKITWNKSSGAAGYRVYRRTSPKGTWKAIADVTKRSYVDPNPVNNARNYYAVRAMKANGKVGSDYSANPVNLMYYKAPRKLKATPGEKRITLTWRSVKNAPLYRIERRKGSGKWKTIGTSKTNSYVDTNLSYGWEYRYRVRVVTADGKAALSQFSNIASVVFSKEVRITSLANQDGHVRVIWNKIAGAASYRLYRKTNDGDWFTVTTQAGTSFNDYDVVNNVNYTYYVRGLDAAGEFVGQYDAKGQSITFFTYPTVVSVTNVEKGLQVKWEAVDGIGQFVIFRQIDAGSWEPVGTSTTLTFTDGSMPSGTYCKYTVASADAAGNIVSTYGVSWKGATSYIDEPLLTGISNGIGCINISWQAVDLAPQYTVYRYIGDTVPDQLAYWTKVQTTTQLSWSDPNPENNRTYWYTVAVRDSIDTLNLSDLNRNALSIVYYTPPTVVSAANDVDGVLVKWNKVDGAASYKIYRWTGNGTWTLIGTAPATSNSFVDGDVKSTGHYWYSVASVGKNDSAYYDENNGAKDTTFYGTPGASIANGDGSISISWGTVDGIGTYRLVQSNKNWDDGTVLYEAGGLSYTENAPTSGKIYYYKLCSVESGVKASGWRTLKIKYLEKPEITAITSPATKKVKLNWNKVEGASYYVIEVADSLSENWQTIYSTEKEGKITEITITTPYSNVSKRFRIRAVSGSYESVTSKPKGLAIK